MTDLPDESLQVRPCPWPGRRFRCRSNWRLGIRDKCDRYTNTGKETVEVSKWSFLYEVTLWMVRITYVFEKWDTRVKSRWPPFMYENVRHTFCWTSKWLTGKNFINLKFVKLFFIRLYFISPASEWQILHSSTKNPTTSWLPDCRTTEKMKKIPILGSRLF